MNEDLKLQTFEALQKRKKPVTKTLTLVTDEDKAEEAERLEREVSRLRLLVRSGDERYLPDLQDKQRELDACKAVMRESAVFLKFQSIGRRNYDKLMSKHPPSAEQREEAKKAGENPDELGWDTDTFPPALVAACLIEPVVTEDQAAEMLNGEMFNNAESMSIFATALEVNTQRKIFDLGNV